MQAHPHEEGRPDDVRHADDLEGQVEILAPNLAYASNESKIDMGKVLLVRGRVDHPERGATKLIAQEVEVFEPTDEEVEAARKQADVAPIRRRIVLHVDDGADAAFLEDLKHVVCGARGDYELWLKVGERCWSSARSSALELALRVAGARRRRLAGGLIRRLYRLLRRAGRKKRAGELGYSARAESRGGNARQRALPDAVHRPGRPRGPLLSRQGRPRHRVRPARQPGRADEASRRVGLDPLADDYRELGTDAHTMKYVASPEAMPFADGGVRRSDQHQLADHVDDLERTASEIKRVTRPGGHLVLAVEVGHDLTWTEPQSLRDVCDVFAAAFEVVSRGEYERDEVWMFDAALRRERFDHANGSPRSGVLTAVMRRR